MNVLHEIKICVCITNIIVLMCYLQFLKELVSSYAIRASGIPGNSLSLKSWGNSENFMIFHFGLLRMLIDHHCVKLISFPICSVVCSEHSRPMCIVHYLTSYHIT